ncbi:MAG: SAM-dependent methyltransferase [Bacilli bacterium]|nr:SAM-dependent methyltransferase [Bacilli bacterium]
MSLMKEIIQEIFNDQFIKATISNARKKEQEFKKVIIRKVKLKNEMVFQFEKYTQKQVFHENLKESEAKAMVEQFLITDFKQVDALTSSFNYCLKISKKEKLFVSKKAIKAPVVNVSQEHNRSKQYLIPDGSYVAPLYDIGIFTKEGKVVHSMYDKYKQINRFVEMIDDCISDDIEHLNIIDFGCGKSYLTFILYYYLVYIKKITVDMIGLDLKEEVINDCNKIAKKYNYDGLKFEIGDINGYQTTKEIDMVISLHACDTATDFALYNAIKWNAKMIFSVPCCQHEINGQIKTDNYSLLTKYGLLKERMSAILTDEIRANLLESQSYKVQVLEFIDLAHSPKNILLRCVKSDKISKQRKEKAIEEVEKVMKEFNLKPTLYKLLNE